METELRPPAHDLVRYAFTVKRQLYSIYIAV
jgi:hypothetical protein